MASLLEEKIAIGWIGRSQLVFRLNLAEYERYTGIEIDLRFGTARIHYTQQ